MKNKKFKVLLLNSGYFTGINGSKLQYIYKAHRFFYLRKKIKEKYINELRKLMEKENPDLVCLIEVKKGKQCLGLINQNYKFCDIENKYGEKSKLRKLPYFKNNCNGFLSKDSLEFQKYYMENGTKKLIYEIILPDNISLILIHFSLKKKVRNKQFQEIHKMFAHREKKIICGDFNIFKGLKEIQNLTENGFYHSHKEATFPAFAPNKSLDLFLCSSNIEAKSRILDYQISDHLPVILEL